MTPHEEGHPDPAVFLDCAGNEWEVRLTAGSCERIRTMFSLDMIDVAQMGDGFTSFLAADPVTIAGALWEVVKWQARAKAVTREQFVEGIDGDALDRAAQCLTIAAVQLNPLGEFAGLMTDMVRKIFNKADEIRTAQARLAMAECALKYGE